VKGRDTTRITRAFKSEFQLVVMEVNTTSLFNVTLDIEEHNEIEMEIDQIEATLIVMEECMQSANAITTLITTTSYTLASSTRGLK